MTFKPKDHYFKKAKKENYLARSVYKLEEIDKKEKLFKKGDHVIDLGYHPGSWTQYAATAVGENGLVIGIDIKPVNKKILNQKNIRLLEKDVFDVSAIEEVGGERIFDVLLSDMAPNTTGIKSVDQDRSLNLVEKVFELLPLFLKPGGNMIIKVLTKINLENNTNS